MASLDTLSTDYRTITEACGLLDRSERGKLALTGRDAEAFLQGQVTNDVEGLSPGQGCYAAFLTPKGKMLGDLRILDTGDELLLDTERVALQALFNMIRRFSIGYDVELHKRTLERGLLSLIGPGRRGRRRARRCPADEHAHALVAGRRRIGGACDPHRRRDRPAVRRRRRRRAAVRARGRGRAVGAEAAAECLRVERGRPRYGIDLDDSVIPQEAGLNERAVSFTKGCYVGQETVARLYYRGKPNRQLRGLRLSAPASSGDRAVVRGAGRSGVSRASRIAARSARSRSRWSAARPRRGRSSRSATTARRPRSSSCRSPVNPGRRRIERQLRRVSGAASAR